ncbi:hypothetical protein BJX70DRAFT_410007 [Aspergillus crustosus]
MSWLQVSPTRYERPTTGIEEYLYAAGNASAALYNRQQYTLFSTLKVKLRLPSNIAALKHAWTQSRYEEPELAATLEANGKTKVYEVPDEHTLHTWLASTFIISPASSADEIYRTGGSMNTTQATFYYLPKSFELVLHAPHWLIDGTGLLLFWDRFLSALVSTPNNIVFGVESARLNPTVHEMLSQTSLSPENVSRATDLFYEYISSLLSIGPVSATGKTIPGACRNLEYRWSVSDTTAIIKACKEKGNHTITAALAQKLAFYYKTTIRYEPEKLEFNAAFGRIMAQVTQSAEFLAAPIPSDALVSSIGVVEGYLKREYSSTAGTRPAVVVQEYKMGMNVVLGRSQLSIYSFRDQLRVVYNFNEGYEEERLIQGYLDEMAWLLRGELLGV